MHSINRYYQQKEVQAHLQREFTRNKQLPRVALGKFLTRKVVLKNGWHWRYKPDQHRYKENERKRLNKTLATYVRTLLGKRVVPEKNRQFLHGSYTLLHDASRQKKGVRVFYFPDAWDPAWGGMIVFMKNGRTLGSFVPQENTLLIVEQHTGVQYFVKYVNHTARKKLLILG